MQIQPFSYAMTGLSRLLFAVALAMALAACVTSRHGDLGDHHFQVTASKQAQQSFDRGLTLAYAFSYKAAEDEFRAAAAADPKCAMAWWGVALVNGPHINFPLVPPANAKIAWEALTKARALAGNTSPREQALIRALGARHAWPQPENRRPLDEAYVAAMLRVRRTHPNDADILTLYAESLMDLRPWDLWTLDGKAQPGTPEIVATLERALALNPRHPGANHLYIHAVEASPNPGRAIPAADRLRNLVPAAGHLVHMPAHIDARVGRWDAAATANIRAMKADAAYRAKHPRPGFYAIYMAHNAHFYAFTAMMQGRSGEALKQARKMVRDMPADFLENFGPVADGFMIFPSEVLMRFGRWEEVLAEPQPAANLPLANALWRYTRTAAFNALGRSEETAREKSAFQAAAARVPKDATFGNNAAHDLLTIATHTLEGEIAARQQRYPEAIASLRRAVALEDKLRYDEPPDWIQPGRHSLGAVLLRAGRHAEAEKVYRADLLRYPANGWSLFGLGRALRLQGKEAEAATAEQQFKQAWSKADIELSSTCLCLPPF
jgi:tetratricopeptide (TPR) repeat protein